MPPGKKPSERTGEKKRPSTIENKKKKRQRGCEGTPIAQDMHNVKKVVTQKTLNERPEKRKGTAIPVNGRREVSIVWLID